MLEEFHFVGYVDDVAALAVGRTVYQTWHIYAANKQMDLTLEKYRSNCLD